MGAGGEGSGGGSGSGCSVSHDQKVILVVCSRSLLMLFAVMAQPRMHQNYP